MKLYGTGVLIGVSQRTSKDGRLFNNVNIDFDGELLSLSASDIGPFTQLKKYEPYTFTLFYGEYVKDGKRSTFMRVESAVPVK